MEIQPNIGVGNVLFNANREDIRRTLSTFSIEIFKRTADSEPAFYVEELGVFIYFSTDGFCEALEFAKMNDLYFNGIRFSEHSYSELENWFRLRDDDIEIEDTGFSSFKFGIGAYISDKECGDDKMAEGIIVFREGYYDE